MRIGTLIGITALLVGMCGCAMQTYQQVKPETYPATKEAFDITFGWKKALTDNGMTIEGYARNNRYYIVQDLELRVAVIGVDGKAKTEASYLFVPRELNQNEMAPFSVTLKVRPQAGDKLRFDYRYLAVESKSSDTWLQSFEINALD